MNTSQVKFDESIYENFNYELNYDNEKISKTDAEEQRSYARYFYNSLHVEEYSDYDGQITAEIAAGKFYRLIKSCVKSVKRYKKTDIEESDLIQTGYVELLKLCKECRNQEFLTAYICKYLKNRMYDAIEDLTKSKLKKKLNIETVSLDALAETADVKYTERSRKEKHEKEMFEYLCPKLTETENKILRLKYERCSNRKIAEKLGKSHTAVNKQVNNIKKKIAGEKDWFREQISNYKYEEYKLCKPHHAEYEEY